MYSVLDFICILAGGYLMYTGIIMKTQGKILENVVLSKGATEASIRDKEAFIQYLHGKLTAIGAVIVITGVVNFISDFKGGDVIISSATTLIFFAALVVYYKVVKRAMKKFVM